jgi:competence protein ComEA
MKKLLMLFLFFTAFNVFAAPVDVNTADAPALAAALHGIGLKKAQAIVADREKNGPFKTLQDLGRVKGIGDKTLEKNKADIQFGAVAAAPVAAAAPAAPAPAPVAASSPVAATAAAVAAKVAPAVPAPAVPAPAANTIAVPALPAK